MSDDESLYPYKEMESSMEVELEAEKRLGQVIDGRFGGFEWTRRGRLFFTGTQACRIVKSTHWYTHQMILHTSAERFCYYQTFKM